MMERKPFEVFRRECPELAEQFSNLVEVQRSLTCLDQKTKQLITIGIQTALRNAKGVRQHAAEACRAGATREEITGAVVMNLHLTGLISVLECLPAALEGFERAARPARR